MTPTTKDSVDRLACQIAARNAILRANSWAIDVERKTISLFLMRHAAATEALGGYYSPKAMRALAQQIAHGVRGCNAEDLLVGNMRS